jgi:hypothetical protein
LTHFLYLFLFFYLVSTLGEEVGERHAAQLCRFIYLFIYFILFLQVKKAVNHMQLDFAEKFLKIAKDQNN